MGSGDRIFSSIYAFAKKKTAHKLPAGGTSEQKSALTLGWQRGDYYQPSVPWST
jgi:hypothetical protein